MTNKFRITFCEFHPTLVATDNLKEEGAGKPIWVCDACFNRFYYAAPPICKHCETKVVGELDFTPLYSHPSLQHKSGCPRAAEWNVSKYNNLENANYQWRLYNDGKKPEGN